MTLWRKLRTDTSMLKYLVFQALVVAFFVSSPSNLFAAQSDPAQSDAVTARLISAEDGVAPDAGTISAGLHLDLAEGWKTYWRSPGEVGLPPEVTWDGSQNVAGVEFQWPAPTRFRAFGIENFGYSKEVTFPLQVKLETPGAPAQLNGRVNLLVCADICVPEQFDLSLTIPGGVGIDMASAAQIANAAAKVPNATRAGFSPGTAYLDPDQTKLTVTATSQTPFEQPDIFAELGQYTAFGAPDIRLGDGGKTLWAQIPILSADEDMTNLTVTITDPSGAGTFETPIADTPPRAPFALQQVIPGVSELIWIAAVAFLGGLILNIMPCVLPVLSIKLSSAMKTAGSDLGRIRKGFAMSALGVLAFMWTLGIATLIARSFGLSVGWGLQFQNPIFLAAMIAMLGLFAANMFGLFEINLPQRWTTALAKGESRGNYAGDFATGAFAAVLATPCSAPFLGTAVAFALAGRAIDIAVVFTALGLGLAMPYLVIALRPSMISALPKPGRWMVLVKVVLGLLLAVTALWLISVLVGVAGGLSALVVTALVVLTSVILWQSKRVPAAVLVPLLLLATLAAPMFTQSDRSTSGSEAATLWQPFERAKIAQLVAAGSVVFVDVTADWCLTCKANKALVLDRSAVSDALANADVVPMQADWTRPDPAISRYLEGFGRFGIPFNVVYGPQAPEGIVLPELLSQDAVLNALREAGASLIASTAG